MEAQFWLAAGRGIRDDADQRPRLQIETGTRPQRAENRFSRHVDEFLHHWVAVDLAGRPLDRRVAHQLAPHRRAFLIQFALSHTVVLLLEFWLPPMGLRAAALALPDRRCYLPHSLAARQH